MIFLHAASPSVSDLEDKSSFSFFSVHFHYGNRIKTKPTQMKSSFDIEVQWPLTYRQIVSIEHASMHDLYLDAFQRLVDHQNQVIH